MKAASVHFHISKVSRRVAYALYIAITEWQLIEALSPPRKWPVSEVLSQLPHHPPPALFSLPNSPTLSFPFALAHAMKYVTCHSKCVHIWFFTQILAYLERPRRVMEELGKQGSSDSSPQHPASHTVHLLVLETCKCHKLTESFPNWKQNSQSLSEHTVKSKPNNRLHCLFENL